MQSQFLAAINELCESKNLPKDVVIETVKAALRAAYRKDYGNHDQNIDVELTDSGNFATVYLVKDVMKKVENEDLEISVKNAKAYKKDAKVGDQVRIDVTPASYGRIAAQSAKQVILQRLQEAERDMMYEAFKDRENELINALIHRVEDRNVYVDLGNITTFLPYDQQMPNERYYGGQRIKLYLDKVIKTTKGPQLLISRTHPNLVRKLMELEIPEIREEVVEIKGVSREPGIRCKVAVSSNDKKVDPIGACVGQKGVRVTAVMDELNGERIDIIEFCEEPAKFIAAALSPAKITHIKLDQNAKRASVFVAQDQRPLAIGKNGQNVRLASQLTGWEIDILDAVVLSESDKTAGAPSSGTEVKGGTETPTGETMTVAAGPKVLKITDLEGISHEIAEKLAAVNLVELEQIKGLSVKDFMSIEGIDEEVANTLVEALKKVK